MSLAAGPYPPKQDFLVPVRADFTESLLAADVQRNTESKVLKAAAQG